MKSFNPVILSLILFLSMDTWSQEIKSNTVRFHLNSLPPEEVVVIPADTLPPSIKFISPSLDFKSVYQTNESKLNIIGQLSDESQLKFLSVNNKMLSPNDAGVFITELDLFNGENQVRVVAMDSENNIRDELVRINYQPPVVTLADRITKEAKYYALIIGINDYQNEEIPDLGNPLTDARKLYNTLNEKYIFEKENQILLENATRGDIMQGFDKLVSMVKPEDNVLIFYAGHGWWDEKANIGYWLPSDADPTVKTNWFRNSTLVDYLKEINSKHTLLITDACFGGSIFKTRSAFPMADKAYEKLYELPSRKAMTSGALTEVPDRSSFTKFLIDRLNSNVDTYLSSEQLFSNFRLAVINNSDAVPMYGEIRDVGDQGGDFIFIKRAGIQ